LGTVLNFTKHGPQNVHELDSGTGKIDRFRAPIFEFQKKEMIANDSYIVNVMDFVHFAHFIKGSIGLMRFFAVPLDNDVEKSA
jgi:hypothetical protein